MGEGRETERASPVALVLEWQLAALAMGLCAASLYAFADLPVLAPDVQARELLVAVALGALPACVLVLVLANAAAAVSFIVLRRFLDRAERSALLVVLTCLALSAVLLLPLAYDFHPKAFVLAVLLPPLVALPCGLWVQKHPTFMRAHALSGAALGLAQIAILLGVSIMTARAAHLPSALLVLLVGVALVALWQALAWLSRATRLATTVLSISMLCLLGLVAFSAPSVAASKSAVAAATPPSQPNVIWIVLDTTRADYLGSYGDNRKLTPALDAFAKQATVYDDAFSAAPWTIPSHASMFTGFYPSTHGARDEQHLWLDGSYVTLAETLRASGYQTIALNSNFYLQEVNVLQGFEISRYVDGAYAQTELMRLARYFGMPDRWVDKGASEALSYTQRWLQEARDPERPFFLFVNLYEAHASYIPPFSERVAQLPQGVSFGDLTKFAMLSGKDDVLPARYYRGEDAPRARLLAQALYAAEVRYQDRKLDELLRSIASVSALDDSLVIISADHGENLGEATRWEHQFAINDLLIHVPLIVRYPRNVGNVGHLAGLCSLVDLYPTVLEVLGLPAAKTPMPGRSLAPRSFQAQDAVFSEVDPYYELLGAVELARGHEAGLGDFKLGRRVVHTATHKFIRRSDGQTELYEMAHDPYEQHNLAAEQPALAAQLAGRLDTWRSMQPAYQGARSGSGAHAPVARDAAARLRALGYAQ